MTKFFVGLYNYFERHKVLFYLSLSVCILFMALFAAQVRFEENVTSFFPDTKDSQNAINVFENLKIKDKIMIMLSGKDGVADADSLIEAAETIKQDLQQQAEGTLIKEIFSKADENLINSVGDFVYDNLPLFLSDEDYQRLDTLLTAGNIAALMQKNYSNLISPAGFALKNYIMRDPLGLGSQTLKHLQDFQLEANYELINEHIFSRDGSTLLMFITPVFNTGSTGKNDKLIRLIENELQKAEKEYPQLVAEYFGGPSVGVYNARQIKKDTLVTSSIALIIIIVFISLVFKHKKSIPLIITPVLFGALFALCLIYFIKGGISAIAVGAGSAVMGIALSYSIHMLAHQNHVSSVQQLIREIAYPLTVGSFTTIGAFFGLLFTSSNLLRDFGLFASLALIGTTLFCLVYLPHFLKGQAHVKQGAVLRFIEKLNAYPYEKNKGLVGGILVLTIICLFTSQNVRFNEDMMSLNYEPAHLKQSENKLAELFDKKEKTVLFVSTGKDMGDATGQYAETNRLLAQLKEEGKIKDYASAGQFLIPEEVQEARLKQWHNYWTPEKKARLRETIRTEAARYHFREHAFEPFFQWLDRPFQPLDYQNEITTRLLNEWQTSADSLTMLITQVRMNETDKEAVYPLFQPKEKVVIFDRGYFASQWVSAVNQDFYLILYISSFLIFFALWISYGRIELTLMSFLPMLVSWIIIVGLMGILGIEFNIINIILSTFIFGIGDDFSIFIMDGLQNKYRTGRQLLNSHKTAIFFSAFTTVIGMGTLVFARHPALQSISLISILGMIAVVLVAYTLQPILFRFFITAPASKGLPPYTLTGLARTGGLFLLFFIGCLFLRLLIAVMTLLPIRKAYKKQVLCQLIHVTCKGLIHIATFVHKEKINRTGETFKKPAILIANHQSFIDILVLLALTPKLVMVTNHWVWHSPFFGAIIRYADFYYVGDGYELYVERMRQKVKEGYSIAIFPEGTRTYDGRMKRFHKGAFYLSEKLQLDIIPVILYGNCKIIAKAQPFNVRKGIMLTEILPRIPANDATYGTTYQERTKSISARMKKEYARICREQSTTDNPVFYENLIQNYIYKGPVEEWYIRIKVKMEDNYRLFNRLVPVKGQITDIGCGFGPLCYMLSQLSEEREITGIDYDEDKIAVAQQGWLRTPHLQFVCANALEYPLPESDVFILNDVLHYMSYEHQRTLLLRCVEQLRPGGKLIVRDGNAANTGKHRLTRFTELLSTGIFNFNKTTEQLCFTSEEQIRSIAQACGMQLEILPNDRYTSNTIYIFPKNEPEHE
ncbi:trifunctional MMPL family transporter/lysophospholipid acyltransferase/class I SAM-dependent methyltransferase [Phocaeicola vulgatus]|uniref:trifunctional MMPL family transporter/lysophospholipid acyltransferase/class I SAM-dependent methyltransferase n=1 Tax=Phocaeicola vulgatus TaxID=821 RepID=UPI000E4F7F5C|nr:trifunctional MMPL family transporter/lysophospholipid acyltransferase/class I SAM-dependent methyltransferase [Phocaeicola vulgatus]RGQ20955.1 methyltransferase domain-containing protein [Phocaeicola vulgatus]